MARKPLSAMKLSQTCHKKVYMRSLIKARSLRPKLDWNYLMQRDSSSAFLSHDLTALCLQRIYHWLLIWKAKFYYKNTLWKEFWRISVLKIHTCLVYFTDELSHKILDTCSRRSSFLEKIGLETPLQLQFH